MVNLSEKLPPNAIESEQLVLGCMMANPDTVLPAVSILKPQDFYNPANKRIFSSMVTLHEEGDPIDVVTVCTQLVNDGTLKSSGGRKYINDLALQIITTANVEYHIKKVHQKSVLRNMIVVGNQIINRAYSDDQFSTVLDEVETIASSIGDNRIVDNVIHAKDVVYKNLNDIVERYESDRDIAGLSTGFREIDNITAGLHPSDLIILAGRPSQGKTALSLNIAGHATLSCKVPTAFFSLEMSKEQLIQRLMCSEGRIDSNAVRIGKGLTAEDFERLGEVTKRISKAPLFIDDTPRATVLDIRAKARKIKRDNPDLGLVIIDYLQLMEGNERDRVQEISKISRGLKQLARELNVPVVALSQLSRAVEQRQNKRPILSDLRDSGSIEQDADIVMFVYRDEYYYPENIENRGDAEIIIGKQRNGAVGTVKLLYHNHLTRFENTYGG